MPTASFTELSEISEGHTPLKPNRRLTALAREAAQAAAALLPEGQSMLLVVVRSGTTLRLIWWDANFRAAAQIESISDHFLPASSSEGRMQRAGAALLEYLSGRWPLHAVPADLGVVTDGCGIAFAPERPSPVAPGWIVRHASGAHPVQMILPLDPYGPAALLGPSEARLSLH